MVDELKLKIIGSNGDRLRLAFCDYAYAKAAETPQGDTQSVVRAETFCFDPLTLRVWNDKDLAVGKDSIYIEDEDLYFFGTVFSSHGT